MSDNKPCPICGGCGILENHQSRRKTGYFVACGMDGCHTEGPVRDSADAAWKIWNRRDDSALSQARAEGRREGLEAGASVAADTAQQWDDGEGSRAFNACMAIQDKLLELAKEGKDG